MNDQTVYNFCTVSGGCKVYKGPWGPANIDVIMQRIRLADTEQFEIDCLEQVCSGKILLMNSTKWEDCNG